jgi:tetratricopeptide (TPR) repeat protein
MISLMAIASAATILVDSHVPSRRQTPVALTRCAVSTGSGWPVTMAGGPQPPGDAVEHYNSGTALLNSGHADQAVDHFQRALTLRPDYVEARFNLGAALWSLDRTDEAMAAFEAAHRLAPQRREVLEALIRANEWLGRTETAQRFAAALKALDASRQADKLVQAGFQQSLAMTESRHWQALRDYDKALAIEPAQVTAHARKSLALGWLGLVYLQTGRSGAKLLAQSLDQARQAIRLQPASPLAHVAMAHALSINHQAGGRDHARRALALAPADAEAHWVLGVCLAQERQPGAALSAYQQAVRLNPRNPRFHLELGSALDAARRYAEAEAAFFKALQLAPGYGAAAAGLAYCQLHQSDWKAAIASFRRAIAIDPLDTTHLSGLGIAQHGAEQTEQAIATLQQAIRKGPNTAENYYRYARVMEDVGGQSLAETAYRRAIALRPTDQTYQAAYRRFRKGR